MKLSPSMIHTRTLRDTVPFAPLLLLSSAHPLVAILAVQSMPDRLQMSTGVTAMSSKHPQRPLMQRSQNTPVPGIYSVFSYSIRSWASYSDVLRCPLMRGPRLMHGPCILTVFDYHPLSSTLCTPTLLRRLQLMHNPCTLTVVDVHSREGSSSRANHVS